jgi:hypothetical protein
LNLELGFGAIPRCISISCLVPNFSPLYQCGYLTQSPWSMVSQQPQWLWKRNNCGSFHLQKTNVHFVSL